MSLGRGYPRFLPGKGKENPSGQEVLQEALVDFLDFSVRTPGLFIVGAPAGRPEQEACCCSSEELLLFRGAALCCSLRLPGLQTGNAVRTTVQCSTQEKSWKWKRLLRTSFSFSTL